MSEPFDRTKFCSSVTAAGAPSDLADQVCQVVEESLTPEVTTTKIFREAMRHLIAEDLVVAANYGLRRAIDQLGPAGFLFEQYFEAVLQAHGFETKRNQFLQGYCVEHEVDIVAHHHGKTVLVEAKYRNEHNVRTPLDVIMYADARLIDIARKQERSKTDAGTYEMWVATNTKFTDKAIQYASCRGIHLVGWGYPNKGNLEELVVSKKIYPVTALPSISRFERERFAEHNMILAQDLLPYSPDELTEQLGFPPEIASQLLYEARVILGQEEAKSLDHDNASV